MTVRKRKSDDKEKRARKKYSHARKSTDNSIDFFFSRCYTIYETIGGDGGSPAPNRTIGKGLKDMKRVFASVLALALLLTMVFTLASCGSKPKGKYGHEKIYLEFDGNNVSVTVNFLGEFTSKGTFEMGDDNSINITYEDEDSSGTLPTGLVYNEEDDTIECSLGILGKITLEKVD